MDVSNLTDQDTQYRLAGGGGKVAATWRPLPGNSRSQTSDPQNAWTIEFMLQDGTILSAAYPHPKVAVELMKSGNHYKIKAIRNAA